jgi:hypothetical protein
MENYMEHSDSSLKIGDAVVFVDYADSTVGEIVERLNADYVRVKWADDLSPTIHRLHSLSRIDGSGVSGRAARRVS